MGFPVRKSYRGSKVETRLLRGCQFWSRCTGNFRHCFPYLNYCFYCCYFLLILVGAAVDGYRFLLIITSPASPLSGSSTLPSADRPFRDWKFLTASSCGFTRSSPVTLEMADEYHICLTGCCTPANRIALFTDHQTVWLSVRAGIQYNSVWMV